MTARAGGKTVTKAIDVVVDRTLAGLQESLPVISPTGDGINDTVTFSFSLAQNVPVRVEIVQDGFAVATPFQGQLGVGPHAVDWDGTTNGVPLPDGAYFALVTVTDALGDVQLSLPLTIDTIPPVLKLLDAKTLKFSLSEPATVTVRRQPEDAARQERAEGHVHGRLRGHGDGADGGRAGCGRQRRAGRHRVTRASHDS